MRKFLLTICIIFFTSGVGFAAEEKITLEVNGIDAGKGGNLVVLVFGSDGFPVNHEKALLSQITKVSAERMIFTFDSPSTDELAFKVLHDEDSNNKVTKNWTGIWPREGLGFSNGAAMSAVGPPSFDAAKISRSDAIKGVAIRVIYP